MGNRGNADLEGGGDGDAEVWLHGAVHRRAGGGQAVEPVGLPGRQGPRRQPQAAEAVRMVQAVTERLSRDGGDVMPLPDGGRQHGGLNLFSWVLPLLLASGYTL